VVHTSKRKDWKVGVQLDKREQKKTKRKETKRNEEKGEMGDEEAGSGRLQVFIQMTRILTWKQQSRPRRCDAFHCCGSSDEVTRQGSETSQC